MTVKTCVRAAAALLLLAAASAVTGAALKFPFGPSGNGRFGAYYTKLVYGAQWDDPWRVGPRADVVVRFDRYDYRLVFWRGTNYMPCWVNDSRKWYTDGGVKRANGEVKWDRLCRYSRARIIENSDARVVVHWRCAPVDTKGNLINTDSMTNWNDWVDEFYTIYPDAVGVRRIKLYSSALDQPVFCQESTVLNEPGARPQDNVSLDAVTLMNLNGESRTYSWKSSPPSTFLAPDGANIQIVNLGGKNGARPFQVLPPTGVTIAASPKSDGKGNLNNLDNWSVVGTTDPAYDRPSHTPLTTITWKPYAEGRGTTSWMMMVGLTNGKPAEIVAVAKSWLKAPKLVLAGGSYESGGYDPGERAYQLACKTPGDPTALSFRLLGRKDSPVCNPAFVIKGLGRRDVSLKVNGLNIPRGPEFRYGCRKTTTVSDLIVWVKMQAASTVSVEIAPVQVEGR